jgi:hypothetical protein
VLFVFEKGKKETEKKKMMRADRYQWWKSFFVCKCESKSKDKKERFVLVLKNTHTHTYIYFWSEKLFWKEAKKTFLGNAKEWWVDDSFFILFYLHPSFLFPLPSLSFSHFSSSFRIFKV